MRPIISLIAVLLSGNAWAVSDTAKVVKTCEPGVGENQSFCVAYYSATVTATSAMWLLYDKPKLFCAPKNFTNEIGIKIWQRYLEENPEMLTDAAFETIVLSLQEAYPCDN